ncbi:MAG: hypothetical protein ACRDSR_06065 [Pseudonocardiaceae bacterium]
MRPGLKEGKSRFADRVVTQLDTSVVLGAAGGQDAPGEQLAQTTDEYLVGLQPGERDEPA